jgi:hypothetical protein
VTRFPFVWLVAPSALVCAAAPVCAQEARKVDLQAGRLSDRVPQLARQTGISISVTNETLWRTKVRGVRGTGPDVPPGQVRGPSPVVVREVVEEIGEAADRAPPDVDVPAQPLTIVHGWSLRPAA